MRPRVLPALVIASALVTAMLSTAAAVETRHAKAKPKPKLPDLVVTSGRLDGNPYLLLGKRYRGSWTGVVKNRGKASAGPSVTQVYIAAPRLQNNLRARDPILDSATARLPVGAKERVTADYRPPERDAEPGAYGVWVCADATKKVKESDENNNCRKVGQRKQFYVAFQKWTGRLSGHGPMTWGGTTMETWSTTSADFTMTDYAEPGQFSYAYSGVAGFVVSGTSSGGCTASGSGNVVSGPVPGYLVLFYDRELYLGAASGTGNDYDYLLDCGGTVSPYPGPQNYLYFWTGPGSRPLEFGTTTLSESYTDEDGVMNSWSLTGVK